MKISALSQQKDFDCQFDWPENCFVQGGDRGVVFSKSKGIYRTAFVEAFPRSPDTFIRGEGATLEEAEKSAWAQFERISKCPHANGFDRRDYKNGAAFCYDCGMFKSQAFEPLATCKVCERATNYTTDKEGSWYCEDHEVPTDLQHEWMKRFKNLLGGDEE